MKRVMLIFKKDLKKRVKSPWAVLVLLLIPFVMTTLLGAVFSPSQKEHKLPTIKLLVVDKDKNIASRLLLQALDNPRLQDMFQVAMVEEKEGKRLMAKGKASALIVIPKNFSDNLLNARKSRFQLIKNPAQRFLPTIVEEFMNTFAVIASGFVQVFAVEMKMIRLLLETDIEKISVQAMVPFLERGKDKIAALTKYLDPLLINLKTEGKDGREKPPPPVNIFALVLPAISIMFLLFIIEIFLRDIITEREDGTLQRIMFSPIRTGDYITAKIISGWIMGLLVYLVVVVAGILLFKISWGNYIYLLVFVTVTCFWIAGFFALLNSFFKNRNQAGAVTTPIVLIFSAFGGSIIPATQLPDAFSLASHVTLNHWFIKGVEKISRGDFPTLSFLIIFFTGMMLFGASIQLLKKRIRV